METVSIFEAKNRFSALVSNVIAKGETYLICKNGRPVAELVAHKEKDRLKANKDLKIVVKGELFNDDQQEEWECLA